MPQSDNPPWTGEDLDHLRALMNANLPISVIAARMNRSESDIKARLRLIKSKPSFSNFGPDEEGDVPIPSGEPTDDPAAWVHLDAVKK